MSGEARLKSVQKPTGQLGRSHVSPRGAAQRMDPARSPSDTPQSTCPAVAFFLSLFFSATASLVFVPASVAPTAADDHECSRSGFCCCREGCRCRCRCHCMLPMLLHPGACPRASTHNTSPRRHVPAQEPASHTPPPLCPGARPESPALLPLCPTAPMTSSDQLRPAQTS